MSSAASGASAESAAASVVPATPPAKHIVSPERRFVTYLILATVLLASLPCLLGFAMSRPDSKFVGAVYNIDDSWVYFSWTRQVADGHFFIRNLFTTETQHPVQFNLLILLLGGIVRMTGVSIPALFLVVRIGAATAVLALIYRFYRLLAPDNARVRMAALFFCCLGGGFGWTYWPRWIDGNTDRSPVDTWQPEALTFQSIEMSTLFAVSLLLIVGTLFLLYAARERGQMRNAVGAGVCALLLGNIHTYDIVHVVAAWFAYLVVSNLAERRFDGAAWLQALVAGLIALPSPLYQLYMYQVDPVFHQRLHDLTLSPPFRFYFLGFGVVFVLAVAAAAHWTARGMRDIGSLLASRRAALLPICWAAAAFAISYTPHVDFQRKMLMGVDIPLSLLAGCGYAIAVRTWCPSRLRQTALAACCGLLCLPSTLLWVYRDLRHLSLNRSETLSAPFLTGDETAALTWLRDETAPDSAVLGFPTFTLFVPGWCDRYTYVSHWGETPRYPQKFAGFLRFAQEGVPEEARAQYLAQTDSDYLVWPSALSGKAQGGPGGRATRWEDFDRFPGLLTPVYRNSELTIYRIDSAHTPK